MNLLCRHYLNYKAQFAMPHKKYVPFLVGLLVASLLSSCASTPYCGFSNSYSGRIRTLNNNDIAAALGNDFNERIRLFEEEFYSIAEVYFGIENPDQLQLIAGETATKGYLGLAKYNDKDNQRTIYYHPDLVKFLTNGAKREWCPNDTLCEEQRLVAVGIMGHEIAHLANGDILKKRSREEILRQELVADRQAGRVIGERVGYHPESIITAYLRAWYFLKDYQGEYYPDFYDRLNSARRGLFLSHRFRDGVDYEQEGNLPIESQWLALYEAFGEECNIKNIIITDNSALANSCDRRFVGFLTDNASWSSWQDIFIPAAGVPSVNYESLGIWRERGLFASKNERTDISKSWYSNGVPRPIPEDFALRLEGMPIFTYIHNSSAINYFRSCDGNLISKQHIDAGINDLNATAEICEDYGDIEPRLIYALEECGDFTGLLSTHSEYPCKLREMGFTYVPDIFPIKAR